jgi:hypothetical protein
VSEYAGKYVCWGNDGGGFCFARIVGECLSNTLFGKKEAFIVEDRISKNLDGALMHHQKKTILRREVIDLKKDIFDRKQGMEDLTDDQLFMLALAGRADGEVVVHKGVANMLEAEQGRPLEELANARLKDRMGLDAGDGPVLPKAEMPVDEEGPNVVPGTGMVSGAMSGVRLGYARGPALCRIP